MLIHFLVNRILVVSYPLPSIHKSNTLASMVLTRLQWRITAKHQYHKTELNCFIN